MPAKVLSERFGMSPLIEESAKALHARNAEKSPVSREVSVLVP